MDNGQYLCCSCCCLFILLSILLPGRLNHQRHVTFAGHCDFFALPQRIVYGERIDGDRQMFGVHLREALAARIVSAREQVNTVLR